MTHTLLPGVKETSLRERAALVALLRNTKQRWVEVTNAVEERGSALELFEHIYASNQQQDLFSSGDNCSTVIDACEQLVERWESQGFWLTTVLDSDYPTNLRTIFDRPPLLFYRGELSKYDEQSIAIVGSREATIEASNATKKFSTALSEEGYVIVSGLARGIDTAAHCSALSLQNRTVAVIGTGIARSYPKENRELQEQIAQTGAVLSQFWPDAPPTKQTFPMRNVVMSGFAQGTILMQASERSGAKMQARIALEHNKPVLLFEGLLHQSWAQEFARKPGVHTVSNPSEVIDILDVLYTTEHLV